MKKRFISVLTIALILCMLSFSFTAYAEYNVENVKYGDANSDGNVDITDATEIQKLVSGEDDNQLFGNYDIFDFNGDLMVDIRDVTNLQKSLANMDYKYYHQTKPVTTRLESIPDTAKKIDFVWDKKFNSHPNWIKSIFYTPKIDSYIYDVINNEAEYKYYFDEASEQYNDEFFKDNSLVLIYRFYSRATDYDSVDEMYVEDDTLYISQTRTCYMMSGDMFEYRQRIYSVKKSDVCNVTKFAFKSTFIYL